MADSDFRGGRGQTSEHDNGLGQRMTALEATTAAAFSAAGTPIAPSYIVAEVPAAATEGAGALIFVTDETGGATLAYSDGTDWRRTADRAVVS